jgi:hypothetical protein
MNLKHLTSSAITRLVFLVVALHLLIGACVHVSWMATDNSGILHLYFDYEGVLVFLFFAVVQLWFTISVTRRFSYHEPLGAAWFYLSLASSSLFAGTVLRHVLAINTAINPLLYTVYGSDEQLRTVLASVGTVLGGPVYMILLGTGLYFALRVYKRLGFLARLKKIDVILIAGAMLYALVVLFGIFQAVRRDPSGVTVEHALTWPGDYLLSLLLLEAIFLRRSASDSGWGYVSKVWGAFVAGIFLTSFCSLMNWLTAYSVLTWKETAFVWYLWYPAAGAFALAPALQWEAMETAKLRVARRLDELGLSTSL